MIKVKDGYAKLIGTTYQGSSTNVLLSNGGNFPIHSGRNNEANKLVRTDSNGQLHTGWISTTSGDMGTGTITRIYCSNDDYIRYKTPANFFSSLTNSGNNISITVAGQNRTLQVGYASNSDRVDNRHAISTTPNTGILYKSALYVPKSLSSYWVKLASISSIGQNAEFVATIHVQSGHSGLGRSAILLVYLRGDKSSFMAKSFKICCNSNYDPSRFRLYYRDSDKTSEIWYQTIGRWDGIITTVISQSNEGALYEGLTLYNGDITAVQTPSMSSYITAQVSTITDNISGNATTASKLQTSRTLWGQSFNGTANVSGNIIDTQSIKSISNRYLDLYGSSGVAFYTNNSVKAVVSSSGNFGIGTTSPSYKLQVEGTFKATSSTVSNLFINTGDATLKLYSGLITDAQSDGNICLQTSIDGTDGQTHSYPTQYQNRCNLVLQPRGGQVYIGTNPSPGSTTYKLYVNGKIFSSQGFVKSGSSDSYVLLGGGGHKTIDSFQTNYDGRYVKKSGDMMTGTLTTYTNGSNNYNQGIRINRLAFSNWATLTIGYVGTSTGGTSGNTWIIGTPANSNSLIFTRDGASETSGLCLKGGGNTDARWNGNPIWHAGNDGSGSGLDADLLDGTHKSGLFTTLSSSSSTNLSITIGGTTKAIADLYATQAVNSDTLDNLHASSFMRCDGANSIGLSGGNGNTAGWRLVLEKDCTNAGWSINNIVFSVASRHTGQGIMSIGFHTTNEDSTTYSYQINFKGSTNSNTSSPWRAFYNTSTKKFRLFWYYNDYNSAQINVLSRSGFNVPTNGTWYTALPSDNGTELTIYYNNAQTATQLLNSRKINGTSFNGTADITTSAWGATRTISLTGAVTGSVQTNGSGNITISTTYGTGNITNLDNRYIKKAGDTMYGNLAFSTGKQAKWAAHGTSYITDGNADTGTSLGGDLANLVISSWYGVSFTTSCSGQTYTGKTAVGINCRSGIVYAARFTGPLQGNATSATQLQTSRKINGASFNGTADITTSYWGSTRTLTIGNTGKSVNGSGNVSWSLSEIGAAATNHTHNYIVSRGNVTAESGTTNPSVSGLSMSQVYNNGYPTIYGNVITLNGQGKGQFLVGWSGTSGATAPVYVRSKRDKGDANWSSWAQFYTTANPQVNITGNAATATKWQTTRIISLTGAITGSASIDGSGNININTTYATGNISNLDNRYVNITGDTMTGDLGIRNGRSSIDGSVPYCGSSGINSKDLTELANYKTVLGAYTDKSGTWYALISVRHRNGQGDGNSYGLYLRSVLTASGNLMWGKQYGSSSWQAERVILDSANYTSYTVTKTGSGASGTWGIGISGNAATASKLTTTNAGSSTRPVYFSNGIPVGGAYSFGNGNGNAPVNNGTVCTNLNADMLDGVHLLQKGSRSGVLRSWARGSFTTVNQYFGNGAVVVIDPAPTDSSELWANTSIFSIGDMATRNWQMAFGYGSDTIKVRRIWDGPTYGNWKQLAFIDSNVASATKLATSRTINGTSFNGTANIVTSYWGTARTIYIQDASGAHGSVGVSVNGSTNYNLKLPSTITATLVGNASSATNADKLDGQHSTHYFRKYNRSEMGSSMNLNTLKTFGIFEVRTSEITTTNSPMSGYYPLLNFVNGEHVQMQIAGTTGQLFYRAAQAPNIGASAGFTHSWATFIDNTNYTSYVKKIGTSTVGGTDKPIYLSSGTPTPISSTKGSTSLPVYLNAGTITTCTPSSLFSNLSNSGTKLSISVAGQNRTLTVMYSTSTQYVVSSGNQAALSGTRAANSGIRLYEAYNNGYPISFGNLLSMKGRGSTELLMGWKSGANRMYYRSNSDINEGWSSWQTVATLADISNAVKTGTTGHLAYYSSTSSVSSYNSNVGSSNTPIYLSSGVPKACDGTVLQQIGKYEIEYNSSTHIYKCISVKGYQYPNINYITRNSTGYVSIDFMGPIQQNSIIIAVGSIDISAEDKNIYCSARLYTSIRINVVLKDGANRRDGNFILYIMTF